MLDICCTRCQYPHLNQKERLCHFWLSLIPGQKALPFLHESEALRSPPCHAHVHSTHRLETSLTQDFLIPHTCVFLFIHLCVHFDFLETAPLGQGLFRKPSASKGLEVFSLWKTYLHFDSTELREHNLEIFNSFNVLKSMFYSPGFGMCDLCSTNIWKTYIFCCC